MVIASTFSIIASDSRCGNLCTIPDTLLRVNTPHRARHRIRSPMFMLDICFGDPYFPFGFMFTASVISLCLRYAARNVNLPPTNQLTDYLEDDPVVH